MKYSQTKHQQGFTLIELSIVLVIIGLIVGGVLVGQDLIKAAEQRALIAQIEKYNSAVNTFRGKYNAMPGDMAQLDAAAFGLFQLTKANPLGQGDGNGLIEGGASGSALAEGETLVFWRHLSDANLVDGSYGVVSPSLIVASTGFPTGAVTNVAQSIPQAKLGPAGSIVVYSISGLNYYQVIPVAGISAAGVFTSGTSGMTPTQAFNIDAKLDDGAPNTGIVRARSINAAASLIAAPTQTLFAPSVNAASTAATCTVGVAFGDPAFNTNTYNRIAATGGNDPSCSLSFRFN